MTDQQPDAARSLSNWSICHVTLQYHVTKRWAVIGWMLLGMYLDD